MTETTVDMAKPRRTPLAIETLGRLLDTNRKNIYATPMTPWGYDSGRHTPSVRDLKFEPLIDITGDRLVYGDVARILFLNGRGIEVTRRHITRMTLAQYKTQRQLALIRYDGYLVVPFIEDGTPASGPQNRFPGHNISASYASPYVSIIDPDNTRACIGPHGLSYYYHLKSEAEVSAVIEAVWHMSSSGISTPRSVLERRKLYKKRDTTGRQKQLRMF